MNNVIYQSLIILIFVKFHGRTVATAISINENIEQVIGSDDLELRCNYTLEDKDNLIDVRIYATNNTANDFEIAATFRPSGSFLSTFGKSLFVNGTLTNSHSIAAIQFDDLTCKLERKFTCRLRTQRTGVEKDIIKFSAEMNISVLVTPSKPDGILWVEISSDELSTTPTVPMSSATLSSSTTVTTKIISTLESNEQNDTTASTHSTLQATTHNTSTTSTTSGEDLFTNSSYRATTYNIEQTTTAHGIAEGDNITVICTGDVGKPPATFVFEKYLSDHILSMTYTATETSISEISENCSYYRTSNLTFQVTAQDNNAVIRCVVNSSMSDPAMYVETAPLEVYYEVSMPTITKYPNNSYYIVDEATSINLTCKSNGYPKPNYQWYKENINEPVSTSANWTITDINVTNSGVYTCNVSNTFNGDTHRNAKHVQINIMNKDDIPTTQSSTSCSSSCVGKKEEKSNGNFDDIPTTQSSSNCRSACVDKKEEKSKENLGLVVGIVGAVVAVIVVIIVIIACRRRKSKSPTFKNVSKSSDDSKPKPVTEPRTDDYETIPLGDDAPKTKSSNYGFEAEDINMHNAEYLKKDEEEKRKNESNTPPQPAVYAQVNEASKLKNKQKTEATDSIGNQEEDTYAETQEGIYDKAGDRRHKEKKNDEHYDSSNNLSKQNSNGDSKLAIQTSQVGSYANQGFEKDNNRKVATVSPTVRSSSGSQNDEQTNPNRNSQSKKGNENIIGTEQTGISEDDSSHQTAL